MEYISIKNLDKFQPHYKDGRVILWIRWNIESARDFKIAKLTPSQRWLFIGLICLACKHLNQIPADREWLTEEIRYPLKSILNDLKKLQELELIVTNCNELVQKSTYIQTDNTDNTIQTDNRCIVDFFNYFTLKTKKAFKLTPTNRNLIRQRLNDGFTIEQMKQAVDNFVADDWPGRQKNLDLFYCLGVRNKIDNLDKWLNRIPEKSASDEILEEAKKEKKDDQK